MNVQDWKKYLPALCEECRLEAVSGQPETEPEAETPDEAGAWAARVAVPKAAAAAASSRRKAGEVQMGDLLEDWP